MTAGEWTHVAMSWDTSGDLVLYVNCQETGQENLGAGTFANLTTTERFFGRPSAATRFWTAIPVLAPVGIAALVLLLAGTIVARLRWGVGRT